jgi:hypothetical protein
VIPRPEASEAASYYFTYIDQVEGSDPLGVLKKQLDEFVPWLSQISEERSLHRYAPGKWSMRQVLNHITDTERAFAFRALWFARGFDAPLPGIDQEIAAAGAEADAFSWSAHVEDFRSVRLSTIALFGSMPAAAWSRTGIASGNPFTVRSLAYLIPGHVEHHMRILRERYV